MNRLTGSLGIWLAALALLGLVAAAVRADEFEPGKGRRYTPAGSKSRATPKRAPTTPAAVPSVGTPASTATPFDIVEVASLRPLFARPPDPPPNAGTPEQAALGRRLFFEPKLSADHTLSCASCHEPERALTDNRPRARGSAGQRLAHNTPPLWNLAWQSHFFWDGSAMGLEAAIRQEIERVGGMDGTLQAAAHWLSQDATFLAAFQRAYQADLVARPELIASALAAYLRTLRSPPTRFDRWAAGDDRALAPEELAGLRIFAGKARCLECHRGWRFTDDAVHDTGLGSPGRKRSAIDGAETQATGFKTASLRELGWTAPYMHDGRFASLDDVLDHYTRRLDRRRKALAQPLRAPLTLDAAERADLIAFLGALSSERLPQIP